MCKVLNEDYGNTHTCLHATTTRFTAALRREHDFTDDVNDAVAGFNVGGNNFGHFVTRVPGTLLKDLVARADRAAVISICHFNLFCAVQIISFEYMSAHDVKKENVRQGRNVIEKCFDRSVRKIAKGIIVGSKHGKVFMLVIQRVGQVGSPNGGAERFKSIGAAGNLGDRIA